MAKIRLPKGSGKRLKVSEKSGNFEMDIEWQPWTQLRRLKTKVTLQGHLILPFN